MSANESRREYLLEKANALPLTPGVYIMHDKSGKVIYVGKSRKLKNRVSQYFQLGAKNAKTERMTSLVWEFETILCDTEIEALTLENNFIKQYSPKYNIRLKDAKSYPYIKITADEYPRLVCTRRREDDGAKYFGPYSGTSTVFSVIGTLNRTLGLPSCKRSFPRDIGRERPCIYYQMGRCRGVCTGNVGREEYAGLIRSAAEILGGNTAAVRKTLHERMMALAENERFEEAARCRDTIAALERLREKQKVVGKPGEDHDVIAFYDGESASCVSVFSIRDGILTDRRSHVFGAGEIADEEGMAAFICEQYKICEYIPPRVLLSFTLEDGEREALEGYLGNIAGHKVAVKTPERGELKKLCELAVANAADRVREYTEGVGRDESVLVRLASICGLEVYPERIEAYDISNFGADAMRAGMIVCENGKFKKSDYRNFTVKTVEGTDDYAAMREALSRRLAHLSDEDGSFSHRPDLILLDGGRGHVGVISELFAELGIDIPLLGMVKDDYHKTRALTTLDSEINIAREREVFTFIYKIQEEVHRYTYGRTEASKRKSLRTSSLTVIPGIGEKKAKALLTHFGGLAAIKSATREDIAAVNGIGETDAGNVWRHFHGDGKN
ncbi:MAG: excinuclease ABC subunit UvrC [Clostridia bacterium]|nr:excinuclease ABC subunit UvrC [Clostridia bacterium]